MFDSLLILMIDNDFTRDESLNKHSPSHFEPLNTNIFLII